MMNDVVRQHQMMDDGNLQPWPHCKGAVTERITKTHQGVSVRLGGVAPRWLVAMEGANNGSCC